jgi:hypothetical protein
VPAASPQQVAGQLSPPLLQACPWAIQPGAVNNIIEEVVGRKLKKNKKKKACPYLLPAG